MTFAELPPGQHDRDPEHIRIYRDLHDMIERAWPSNARRNLLRETVDLIDRLEREAAPSKIMWRCFHCDATFTEAQREHARDHFGAAQDATPACQIRIAGEYNLIKLLREQEAELADYRAEDSRMLRAWTARSAEYAVKVREAEEAGYAKGLKDGPVAQLERDVPGAYWIIGKGKVSKTEALYGVVIMDQAGKILSEGEGDTIFQALERAMATGL